MLVIAGLEAWDSAMIDVDTYNKLLDQFIEVLQSKLSGYKLSFGFVPVLIFNMAPFFCCELVQSMRFTTKRSSVMNQLYRSALHKTFPDAILWDTRAMTEALPLNKTKKRIARCRSNHLDSSMGQDDAMLLRGALCSAASRLHSENKAS